ncbi:unnamed protein product, partial [Effrenium voratum]
AARPQHESESAPAGILQLSRQRREPPESHESHGADSAYNEAAKIREACQADTLDKNENVTVPIIRDCVEELQKYAEKTREGLATSIEAEKEFVKHYAKAAKEIAKIGDVVAWMCSRILSYASAKLCISLGKCLGHSAEG